MTVVAFDFDGTLSDSEMTVLLGDRCGVADDMAEITEASMNDEIDYAESLRKRAALLEGLSAADAQAAFDEVELREGAADLIEELNDAGVTTAILTGGFERGVAAALEREGASVDHIVSNRLPMDDEETELTGDVDGPLIEGTKDDALEDLADDVGADLEETVAVGDGANDLPMLQVAGLSIGFEPKPAVEPHCEVVVTSMAEAREVFLEEGVLPEN
ncbi:phosphoserine phosphatase SerB [Natronolimnohabitans innermongolicus]|uniref:phosphoserine phosphatase n=1 Tax=Natronolimnohabitans innermongolicus JCM 12255 TaxID=1227499 RepID=L9X266_9EURY|nr:phosphoserine phosphatase SerB [Natronolimnohabitans innermongolicus]ELY55531.1 phosphoserine phosphatase SerB [Natronolimnohabitans innermongolicus JCM 12255]